MENDKSKIYSKISMITCRESESKTILKRIKNGYFDELLMDQHICMEIIIFAFKNDKSYLDDIIDRIIYLISHTEDGKNNINFNELFINPYGYKYDLLFDNLRRNKKIYKYLTSNDTNNNSKQIVSSRIRKQKPRPMVGNPQITGFITMPSTIPNKNNKKTKSTSNKKKFARIKRKKTNINSNIRKDFVNTYRDVPNYWNMSNIVNNNNSNSSGDSSSNDGSSNDSSDYSNSSYSYSLDNNNNNNNKNNNMSNMLKVKLTHYGYNNVKKQFNILMNETSLSKDIGKGKDVKYKGKYKAYKVYDVWRIENYDLWTDYRHRMSQILNKLPDKIADIKCKTDKYNKKHNVLMNDANEKYLWHGTSYNSIKIIIKDGFDERVCSLNGMFGAGIYFAEDSSKSDQYIERHHDGYSYILLCRVMLGDTGVVLSTHSNERRALCKKRKCNDDRCSHDRFDSLMAETKRNKYKKASLHRHREFVVYDRTQCYPEFLIKYKKV